MINQKEPGIIIIFALLIIIGVCIGLVGIFSSGNIDISKISMRPAEELNIFEEFSPQPRRISLRPLVNPVLMIHVPVMSIFEQPTPLFIPESNVFERARDLLL